MIDTLAEMFSYPFLVRAVVVGLLVSLCSALLGVSLVLKRYSMIGDGLSHVGFGTLAAATAMNVAPLAVSIPVVVLAAFLLLRISESSRIKGDAAIALISTGSLAVGVMIISLTTGMNTDVCNYLFGSILAMSKADVRLSIVLSAAVLVLFALFYNKIFAVTFDESHARATGTRSGLYNMLIAFLCAITIVLGMRMMGAMLISSLIIFPALTSMRVCRRFKTVTICSAVVSVACFFAGVVASYLYATPTGASVVIVNIIAFLLFWAAKSAGAGARRPGVALLAVLLVFALSACGGGSGEDAGGGAGDDGLGGPAETGEAYEAEGYGAGPGADGGAGGDGLGGPAGTDGAYDAEGYGAWPGEDGLGDPAETGEAYGGGALGDLLPGQSNLNGTSAVDLSGIDPSLHADAAAANGDEYIEIKDRLFVAQVNDIYLNAEDYLGKTIHYEGIFSAEFYSDLDATYYFVIRYGPGCCGTDANPGFEVAWDGEYPAPDEWVSVTGALESYQEDGYDYLRIRLSEIEVMDERGEEYVSA
jgi:zinc transport system permease protein